METCSGAQNALGKTFNFLASLINGNARGSAARRSWISFNFLASLINGNEIVWNKLTQKNESFNFLASLINGNVSGSLL